jgi:hypothetical protein
MKPDTLESLVRAVTILTVLSLSVERLTELFKKRDWQPLNRNRLRVDLRSGKLDREASKKSRADLEAVDDDPAALRRVKRSAHAQNTIFIGILLALLTGANAFAELVPPFAFLGKLAFIQKVFQVMLTGAAAGLGSSFWYDMLGVVTEIRRVKEQTSDAAAATPSLNVPPLVKPGIVPQPALKSA